MGADSSPTISHLPTPRNQTMELCKFIASLFVVCIHARFPGRLGSFVDCLARFAVPMFFMITGYFNYQASPGKILRRARHILLLFLIGACFRQVCQCICIELNNGSTIAHLRSAIPDLTEILKLLLLHVPPYTGIFWYLLGIFSCYLIFWAFVQFQESSPTDYRPFYSLCLSVFVLFFALDILLPASGGGDSSIPTRNGWLFGLPMFGAGLFLRQYQQRILTRFRLTDGKLAAIFLLGFVFSVLQWDALFIGIVPAGMLFSVPALLLLTIRHPILVHRSVPARKLVLFLGPLSMWVYLLHLPLMISYEQIFRAGVQQRLGKAEGYLFPFLIAGLSILAGIPAQWLFQALSSRISRRAAA